MLTDDRWIAFDMRTGRNAHIFLISADGASLRSVTRGNSDNILPAWSHDGKWIYFDSNRTGRFEIFKCSPDGGKPIQVRHEGGWGVQESQDGKSLYDTRMRDVSTSLMTMPAADGAESKDADRKPGNFAGRANDSGERDRSSRLRDRTGRRFSLSESGEVAGGR